MRNSPLRHNLARLRMMLNLHQKEFADLVTCSKASIQSIELDRGLKLSESLALRISLATGVEVAWLLVNNLDAPPRARSGEPYNREHFILAQADIAKGSDPRGLDPSNPYRLIGVLHRLADIISTISGRRGEMVEIAYWKIGQVLIELEREFNITDAGSSSPTVEGLTELLRYRCEVHEFLKRTPGNAATQGDSPRPVSPASPGSRKKRR